jgi:hypothetical protein
MDETVEAIMGKVRESLSGYGWMGQATMATDLII